MKPKKKSKVQKPKDITNKYMSAWMSVDDLAKVYVIIYESRLNREGLKKLIPWLIRAEKFLSQEGKKK